MLLHTCCATCALPIIDSSTSLTINPERSRRIEYLLTQEKVKDITLYFYNPNIYPKEEYNKRLKDVEKIAKIYKLKLIIGKYEHGKWLEYIKKSLFQPPEKYLENSERCLSCFRFRLEETVKFTKKNNFDEFATTLSINRFKNINYINQYAKELAKEHQLVYKVFNLDVNKAYVASLELTRKYNLYRQKYCGCEFSTKHVL